MAKIRMVAPDGYKYHDSMTDKNYSEIVIDEKQRDRFELVADESERITEIK